MRTLFYFFLLLCCAPLLSCTKEVPASFWRDYHTKAIVKNEHDMKPEGGYNFMHWEASSNKTFTGPEARQFAERNGWKLVKIYKADSATVSRWKKNGIAFAKFSPFDNSFAGLSQYIGRPLKIYAFKTGWLLVEPTTGKKTEVNGYVVLGNRGRRMSMYHRWGE
ncbi:hypothetical protein DJ568_11110 [Mucilaginibacter hurinus]|uniref:Lipoprotein n=1 Tax=Mucilaginibacter hurinus TaxID=2201324 RepID=A0A367GNE4_9SPHI|nr:hypothetical protein [Mucilaginibacter hurinus]RCH55012.1 hypothetical protein DJ568_11110 [Mucilaginibacter hurinus]